MRSLSIAKPIRALHTFIAIFLCAIAGFSSASNNSTVQLSSTASMLHLGGFIDLVEDTQANYTFKNIASGDLDYQWIHNDVKTPNFGYTDSVFWYRVIIENDTPKDVKKILSVSYPLLDNIDFYFTDQNNNPIKTIATGDTKPTSSRELFHRNFLFELELPKNEVRKIYLRVATQGAQQLPLELWDEREFFLEDQRVLMVKASYFGMMLVMIVFNLFIYFSLKEKSYIYYIAFIFSFVFTQAGMAGFAAQYVWPNIPYLNSISILFFVPFTMLSSALFSIEFLDLKNRSMLFYRFLMLMVILNSLCCILCFFIPYSLSTKISVALVVPQSLAMLAVGPILIRKGIKEARYYTLAWITLVIGTTLAALNKFGLIPRNVITEHGLVIGSAIEAVLLSIALADRFNREREQRYVAQKEKFEEAKERQRIEEAMMHQSMHSPLTKLPNRVLLSSKLDELIARYTDDNFSFALALVHLKRFHEINKTLGHQNADELLTLMAQRLRTLTQDLSQVITIEDTPQESEHVANVEGVTFAVLLRANDRDATDMNIETLSRQIIEPLEHKGMSLDVGVSLGIAFYPDHGNTTSSLLRHAHIAIDMAEHKENQIAIYSKEMNPYSARRLTLMGELRKAIDENSLELYFQPQVNLTTNDVYGVEALLRWNHPTHGFIPPDEFIPLAESTGLIKSLTQWVANRAIQYGAELKALGHDICVSINISALNLQEKSFDIAIKDLLQRHQLESDRLLLEVTETSVMQDTARCFSMMEKLHSIGVKLSVDDFGTGHSSLAYIKKLPVEEIKIDRSFVMEMDKNQDDEVIVKTTINMCHSLGYKVVAEGVESLEICGTLKRLGCDYIQGYYISKPQNGEDLKTWLSNESWEPLLVNMAS
ncbi:MAG: EAL domain-containing protein [Pseudomonadales bacterium]|nr:EAL domain-containing protein [Pseudomonadales bacterium]